MASFCFVYRSIKQFWRFYPSFVGAGLISIILVTDIHINILFFMWKQNFSLIFFYYFLWNTLHVIYYLWRERKTHIGFVFYSAYSNTRNCWRYLRSHCVRKKTAICDQHLLSTYSKFGRTIHLCRVLVNINVLKCSSVFKVLGVKITGTGSTCRLRHGACVSHQDRCTEAV